MSSDTEDETGPDEVAELAAFDAAKYERLELIRRATMFKSGNVQKDAPFKVGEAVFDYKLKSSTNPQGAEAVVIGLPSKKPIAAMGDEIVGAKNYVWIRYPSGLAQWVPWTQVGPAQPMADQQPPPQPREAVTETTRKRHAGIFDAAAGKGVPELAAHERQRKVQKNPPPKGDRGPGKEHAVKESDVPIKKRIEQYPNETFRDDAGVLFCRACHHRIRNHKGTIDRHIKSDKHVEAKICLVERSEDDTALKQSLSAYFIEHPDEIGGKVDADVHLMRYRIMETFAATGAPALCLTS